MNALAVIAGIIALLAVLYFPLLTLAIVVGFIVFSMIAEV